VTDTLEAAAMDGALDLIGSEDYEGRFDPHIWMDPDLWQPVATRIQDALTGARPDQADLFAANTNAFNAELAALRSYGTEALAQVSAENRVLVTAHDAFAYFGRAFDMEVIGVQGISTDSEAGLNRISELVDMLVARNVGAVFVESSVSDRNMRALIEGAAAQGHEVRLGGELFSDAMGEEGTYEGTFIGMLDHNITTIARALGADVPETGLNGRLGLGA
jgi:manganese/zinc/iron transport system substrate-binding protein